ncbi:hypothetical protein DPX16_16874 [Anabarilius grahami]|uniref:Uncharacterized protein n=1 Tax=Anabarilius grahami TaxID=495550 RepID=A0A3N0YSS1_ANAGA|nr:hypothetical protein DPX16_16874 [Anabarilius grahami]
MTSYGATRKYKGAPGETVFISSSFDPVLSDCIYTNSDELVGKFEKVLFSLNFPGAGESDRMTMTFVFDVIASGGERSSGWCMRAAVCLGRASRRAPGERVKKGAASSRSLRKERLDERFLSVH